MKCVDHSTRQLRRVLLTGDRGRVGRWVGPFLRRSGYEVRGFDIRDGNDVTDEAAVVAAAAAADVIMHLATLPFGFPGPDEEMYRVNVEGARNVLAAAEAAGHSRVVVFSSPHVFGFLDGSAAPGRFPVADGMPRRSLAPYGGSKVMVEDLCEAFTARTGIATLCPRPFAVWVPGQASYRRRRWLRAPEYEFRGDWEFGAFVDVRDLAEAARLSLERPIVGHHRFLLAAKDTASLLPAREAARRVHPDVPFHPAWPSGGYERASLVDTTVACELLGWAPAHNWATESTLSLPQRLRARLDRVRHLGLRAY